MHVSSCAFLTSHTWDVGPCCYRKLCVVCDTPIMQTAQGTDPLQHNRTYTTIRSLGRGYFGKVLLAKHKDTDELVAITLVRHRQVNNYVEATIINHSMLRHPFVVEFQEVFLTPDYTCVAMEHVTGGNLFSLVQEAGGKLSEGDSRWFFQQLIIGVDYCHQRQMAIREIKLENTLVQVLTLHSIHLLS